MQRPGRAAVGGWADEAGRSATGENGPRLEPPARVAGHTTRSRLLMPSNRLRRAPSTALSGHSPIYVPRWTATGGALRRGRARSVATTRVPVRPCAGPAFSIPLFKTGLRTGRLEETDFPRVGGARPRTRQKRGGVTETALDPGSRPPRRRRAGRAGRLPRAAHNLEPWFSGV